MPLPSSPRHPFAVAVALTLALPHPPASPDDNDVLAFACPAARLLALRPSHRLTCASPWPALRRDDDDDVATVCYGPLPASSWPSLWPAPRHGPGPPCNVTTTTRRCVLVAVVVACMRSGPRSTSLAPPPSLGLRRDDDDDLLAYSTNGTTCVVVHVVLSLLHPGLRSPAVCRRLGPPTIYYLWYL